MSVISSDALEALRELSPDVRRRVITRLPPKVQKRLYFDWGFWANRGEGWTQQWVPGLERYTIITAGRGWGKTRCGAEAVRHVAENPTLCGALPVEGAQKSKDGRGGWIGIAGRTVNDVNETMLYGPSGLITISPPWFTPEHNRSAKRLTWPNGVVARLFSGDVPESFRGPDIGFLWADELAHWHKLRKAWEVAEYILRRGEESRCLITTTPIGVPTFVDLVFAKDEDGNKIPDPDGLDGFMIAPHTRVVTGSTFDNLYNLDANFLEKHVAAKVDTRLGQQEVLGRIIMDMPGAPWRMKEVRRCKRSEVPDLDLVVVSVDPAMTKKADKDAEELPETGIMVAGVHFASGVLYILEDASGNYDSDEWANVAASLYHKWEATRIVVEDNQGGDLVEKNIRVCDVDGAQFIEIHRVRATKSKYARAGMVNGIWQQGRAFHVGAKAELGTTNHWRRLEHQMTNFDPRKGDRGNQSDRMDALVWAVLGLLGEDADRTPLKALGTGELWAEVARKMRGENAKAADPLDKPKAPRRKVKFQAEGGLVSLKSWRTDQMVAFVDLIKRAA